MFSRPPPTAKETSQGLSAHRSGAIGESRGRAEQLCDNWAGTANLAAPAKAPAPPGFSNSGRSVNSRTRLFQSRGAGAIPAARFDGACPERARSASRRAHHRLASFQSSFGFRPPSSGLSSGLGPVTGEVSKTLQQGATPWRPASRRESLSRFPPQHKRSSTPESLRDSSLSLGGAATRSGLVGEWSPRLPVTEETVGSNPIRPASTPETLRVSLLSAGAPSLPARRSAPRLA